MTGVVVVGVDGTDTSSAALQLAAAEARRRSAQLRIVRCWDIPTLAYVSGLPPTDSIEALLREDSELCLARTAATVSRAHPGLEVETRCIWAPAVSGLVSASEDAVLLVLGSRRRRRLSRLIFGSATEEVSRRASCPVTIVPLQ